MNDGSRWMKHFFIIAGGKIEDAFAIEVLKGFAEKTVIAADSGMEFLRRNEIVPQVIIGDFDSVSKETLEWFQKKEGIVWHRLNPQKDDTDTEFALRLAISMGAECITVLGGTGSRLDHVLGNIELLGIGLELGVEIELLDANNRIRMTDHGMVLKKEEQFGKYVSLIPYTAQVEHLYLAGFKYPLADYCLKGFCSIGVSNEITEEQAEITFENGILIVIESRRRHSDNHTERRREQMTTGIHLFDKSTHHLFTSIEISNYTVTERTDGTYIFVSFLMHHLCLLTHGNHLISTTVQSYH